MKRKSRRARVAERFRKPPPGSPPGTLAAHEGAHPSSLTLVAYGPDAMVETPVDDLGRVDDLARGLPVTWIDVEGLADTALLERLAERFGLHPLALEDIVHVHQRPKVEFYDGHLLLFSRILHSGNPLQSEQLAVLLGPNFVVTFRERPGDCFAPVLGRLRADKGRIREAGADHLAYCLFDAIIDRYFPLIEEYGDVLEALEDEVLFDPAADLMGRIHELRRDLMVVRRAVWPQREVVGALLREESPLLGTATHVYLRDLYDHVFQLMEILESHRDIAAGLVEVYLSAISTRMNEVMKVLTVIATIFIPLGFIASLYGMNFDPDASPLNMPELRWRFGYPFALVLMLGVAGGLLAFFRYRRWIGVSRGLRRAADEEHGRAHARTVTAKGDG